MVLLHNFPFSKGPICILYLIRKTPDNTWSQLLPLTFYKQNLILVYGQLQSTLVNHMDIKRIVDLKRVLVFQ